MKTWMLAGLATLLLTGCEDTVPRPLQTVISEIDVFEVKFPASAGTSAPFTINIKVALGGCTLFKSIEVTERTTTTLKLSARGIFPRYDLDSPPAACLPVINYEIHSYTDPGTPARTSPFEVFVNGKSYGTVKIDPPATPFTREATIEQVTLPEKIGAGAALPIQVRLIRGACERFKGFEVQERTPGSLKLRAVLEDNRPAGQEQLPCAAIAILEDHAYIDPGSPARTSPFEVFVNGKSYGTVSVQ